MTDNETRRQVLYWRLLAGIFVDEPLLSLDTVSAAVVGEADLPPALLDARISVDTVVQRYPELGAEFEGIDLNGTADSAAADTDSSVVATDRDTTDSDSVVVAIDPDALVAVSGSRGPDHVAAESDSSVAVTDSGAVASGPIAAVPDPTADGFESGSPEADSGTVAEVGDREVRTAALASKLLLNIFATGSGAVSAAQLAAWQADAGWLRRTLGDEQADELRTVLADLEAGLVQRMQLREVLADPYLAAQLSPSMSLIEQLLRDKHNLSGVALANAKALIRRFVDEVAAVLRTQVQQSTVGSPDRSVPPKRILRNLDMDRTIWKNLPNWSPEDQRLYVDRLYYRQTAKRTVPARMIVVVDQSGSMVDAMVNCTILASIFAGLPKVDVHLIAYDTNALDLTPWVHDPFEVLLRTQLGGGTDGRVAMTLTQPKVSDPKNTVVVWISDFYEWQGQELFESMEALYRSGVKFIPVGSVGSSGQQSVNPWFRERFKNLGTPVLSGRINKLVHELKTFLD